MAVSFLVLFGFVSRHRPARVREKVRGRQARILRYLRVRVD
jgi:hypothetical protein